MFIDEIKIFARAGHGGKGCVAFHREAYRPKGGPSGGNGGRGGNIILEASHDLNNLIKQFYESRLIAEAGQQGLGKGMDGYAGEDLIVKVPCGTLVWRLPSTTPPLPVETDDDDESEEIPALIGATAGRPVIRSGGARAIQVTMDAEPEESPLHAPKRGELVCDLTQDGQRFTLCKGGRGGLGNRNFATSVRQAPRFAQPGEPGVEGDFLFELRLVADVGIVGYPNAGKSTLLAAISKARPKIAAYPFTTLTPQVGIVEYPDFRRLTLCDVPGLIAGAHENIGLGHKFLRHIARCPAVIILLDMAGTDNREPLEDYKSLLQELELYDPALMKKPRLVVANKMDEPQSEANLKAFKRKVRKVAILPISAAFGEGMPAFVKAIRELVEDARETSDSP